MSNQEADMSDQGSPIPDFDVFYGDELTAHVEIKPPHVYVTRYVIHPVKQIFYKDELNMFELGEVLRLRCWSKDRDNLDKYLKKLGLDNYDVYGICRKTHGVSFQEYIWFRFEGETITSKDGLVKE